MIKILNKIKYFMLNKFIKSNSGGGKVVLEEDPNLGIKAKVIENLEDGTCICKVKTFQKYTGKYKSDIHYKFANCCKTCSYYVACNNKGIEDYCNYVKNGINVFCICDNYKSSC